MRQAKILLLDCHPGGSTAETLRAILAPAFTPGEQLRLATRGDARESAYDPPFVPEASEGFEPDLVFVALGDGRAGRAAALVESLRRELPASGILLVFGGRRDPEEVLALLRAGADDFITTPLAGSDILPRVWRQLEHRAGRADPVHTLRESVGLRRLVGESENFVAQVKKIPLVARSDGRILITGETGTGKEMCARAIHYLSPRAARPFVPVNCGAIPVELVENELFGHERGAFTGANSQQHGLIHEAEGGTLFLDEVDCLPLLAQTKLLRFLQEHEYRPLGSSRTRRADVRVIAASNVDLEEAVADGRVRRDLYYRMNVVPLALPPLRERREDIPALARHFLAEYAAEFDRPVALISREAMEALVAYDWPGNVRELEHAIERAVMLCAGDSIAGGDLSLPRGGRADRANESFRQAKARVVAQFERAYVEGLLVSHEGNISSAARAARKNRRAFWQLIRKHQIDVRRFKPHAP
ncbi:MAG TPA: sigma-54 dependent transcriptional regulator [Pyrinomonadaceae bacterium]|nr:sigma-54 dependent transcriptional regulator [Pyrinomonadaceae bacterium]